MTTKFGRFRWNVSMLKILTNHRDVQQKGEMERKWRKEGEKESEGEREIGEVRD